MGIITNLTIISNIFHLFYLYTFLFIDSLFIDVASFGKHFSLLSILAIDFLSLKILYIIFYVCLHAFIDLSYRFYNILNYNFLYNLDYSWVYSYTLYKVHFLLLCFYYFFVLLFCFVILTFALYFMLYILFALYLLF